MIIKSIPLSSIAVDDNQIRSSLTVEIRDVMDEPSGGILADTKSRIEYESIVSLAHSITDVGLIQPIVVYLTDDPENPYKIIAGERRFLAALYAFHHLQGGDKIRAITHEGAPDHTKILDIQFAENIHRNALRPREIVERCLSRFEQFEEAAEEEITASDIQNILSVKKTQSHLYLKIYRFDRDKVNAVLASEEKIDTLRKFLVAIEKNEGDEVGQGGYFNVSAKCQKPPAIEALINKLSTPKQRKKYVDVDWDSPRETAKAFREFMKEWEAKF